MKMIMKTPTVVRTDKGIEITGTHIPLHRVVHLLKEEWPESLIQMRFEFTDQQMADTLAYIKLHPEEVEVDYIVGRQRMEERLHAWRNKPANVVLPKKEKQWPTWWPDDAMPDTVTHIIETKGGPMISNSRVSVYDVMEVYDDGSSSSEIREIYNLSSYQVKVALQYIEAHRETLEPELKEILIRKAESERRCREYQAAYRKWRMETNPPEMTPRRAALKALIEERRRALGES